MNGVFDFEDTLEPIGIVVGVLVVLVGVAIIVGMPWQIKPAASAGLQVVGALGLIGVGAALAWLSKQ
ncbi:hypothetical protein VB773_06135 [Haloarculaceae archaeon H-GB2-1]|nr:hypothetical protein [Haloarculaceae archaeon H-GB1-1]MEA5385693.1 hypothetical protein [Haloarculaceae archaeon H-GB11]MEA5407194.1 hypothetical protein [Haloarculaceae archaeon H-GB2-1]